MPKTPSCLSKVLLLLPFSRHFLSLAIAMVVGCHGGDLHDRASCLLLSFKFPGFNSPLQCKCTSRLYRISTNTHKPDPQTSIAYFSDNLMLDRSLKSPAPPPFPSVPSSINGAPVTQISSPALLLLLSPPPSCGLTSSLKCTSFNT